MSIGILFIALMPRSISAADTAVQLTLEYPCSDVKFRVYRFADEERNLTDAFAGYGVSFECENNAQWLALAVTLSGYVSRDQITPLAEAVTVSEKAVFRSLEAGWYLVEGDPCVQGDVVRTPVPFVLALQGDDPALVQVKWDEKEHPGEEPWSCTVKKVWKDAGQEGSRPQQVKIQLLKDQEVYDTVVLSQDNGWQHHWDNLDSGSRWMVVEVQVPDAYTVAVTQEDRVFTVTNTRTGTLDKPGGNGGNGGSGGGGGSTVTDPGVPSTVLLPEEEVPLAVVEIEDEPVPLAPLLPQTGQLWWPVPWLCLGGLLCIAAGLISEKKRSRKYEK